MSATDSPSTHSFGSDYSYGVIKVGDNDSESLVLGGHSKGSVISFHSSNELTSRTDVSSVQPSIKINEALPREIFASDFTKIHGIDQSKEILERIVESYNSETGGFLTKSIYLNHKIYSNKETIMNGSVKINIIQEINELLRTFLPNEKGDFCYKSLENVKATIAYYDKLMNAFGVLNRGTEEDSDFESNRNSQIYKTPSIESTNSTASRPKRNSIIFNKLRPKVKSPEPDLLKRSVSNLKSSRTLSISTISSNNSVSARSIKDQASLTEYFQSVEFLYKTILEIHDLYMDSNDSDICNRLNYVIEFQSEFILKFLLQDIFNLLTKYMKRSIQSMV